MPPLREIERRFLLSGIRFRLADFHAAPPPRCSLSAYKRSTPDLHNRGTIPALQKIIECSPAYAMGTAEFIDGLYWFVHLSVLVLGG